MRIRRSEPSNLDFNISPYVSPHIWSIFPNILINVKVVESDFPIYSGQSGFNEDFEYVASVDGFKPYMCGAEIDLTISSGSLDKKQLEQVIVHEFNHLSEEYHRSVASDDKSIDAYVKMTRQMHKAMKYDVVFAFAESNKGNVSAICRILYEL